jgi:hypothetical protein
MRAALSCALALLAATALSAALSRPVPGCGASDSQTDRPHHPKASSFAPHADSTNHVYGAPIQSRILKSHPKKTPQLKTAPLPDA